MLIEVGDAVLEVTLGGATEPGIPILCAAHPASAFGESVVTLLQQAAGIGAVCVNPRGLGRSTPATPGGAHTLDDMVDDLEGVRRRLGLGAWVFWGMSGGGWLGQIYAHRYPDALSGLILESVCPCFRARLADPECLLSPFHSAWRPTLEERGLLAADSHQEVGDPRATEWIEVEGVGSVFRRNGGPALLVSPAPQTPEMHKVMPVLWAVDTRPWLSELRLPTLVLCGTADPFVPLTHARALHEAIAGSDFVAVEGAGHVPVSQHRPEAGQAVRDFLRSRVGWM